jgi:hypothetical protein
LRQHEQPQMAHPASLFELGGELAATIDLRVTIPL